MGIYVYVQLIHSVIKQKLTHHFKHLEKKWQNKPRVRKRKEIIKIRVQIDKIETKCRKKSVKRRVTSLKRSVKFTNF